MLPKHAIYPSPKIAVYISLLVGAKFLRAVGLFLAYDILKLVPVVLFLFIIKAGAALPLVFLQKPFSSGKRISKNQWFRIFRHAFFGALLSMFWMFGLSLCGPLRTILLYEHSDLVVIAWATAVFSGAGPSKMRGALCFIVAVISLLLFDHDEMLDHLGDHDSSHKHYNFLTHIFYHIIGMVGWSDHKGGVVLLFLTLCLQVGYNSAAKKLSVDIGGAKRLHTLSTLVQSLMLGPWALIVSTTAEMQVSSWLYLLFPIMLIVFFVFIVDYYIEAVSVNHLQPPKTAEFGAYAISISAFILAMVWNHPLTAQITTINKLKEIITEDHVLSYGVIFSLGSFMLATKVLLSPGSNSGNRGKFIGYSPAGIPLYSFTGDMLHKTSQSILLMMKNGLRQILEESDSRRIFYFLCINLMFTFVELIYGVWTNSLGLISDGFHMLFDCSALVMGLYAAVMTRWKATRIFSYGFDRVEVLSGFINGLFLVVIATFVFTESLHRLLEPPEIDTNRLLAVSVLGLMVNLIGILAFRGAHGHSHGGGHGHSHGGHAHGGHAHGHSHGGHSEEHIGHNTNMEGVFLHVLADTLGSVGVIISTLLIDNFGWNIADPICSIFIASMILLSVLPLLKETAQILLLRTPAEMEDNIITALEKVMSIEGVIGYKQPHFWFHTSSKIMGSLHLQIAHTVVEQKLISQVSYIFKEAGIHTMTFQIEKEAYYQHLSGLGAICDSGYQDFRALSFHDKSFVTAI